jgi:hypothetical protein
VPPKNDQLNSLSQNFPTTENNDDNGDDNGGGDGGGGSGGDNGGDGGSCSDDAMTMV